jgi:hypothetical protein
MLDMLRHRKKEMNRYKTMSLECILKIFITRMVHMETTNQIVYDRTQIIFLNTNKLIIRAPLIQNIFLM